MTCTLGAFTGEGGILSMGLLPTCIFGFVFSFPGGLLSGTLGDFFVGDMWEHFKSIVQKSYGGY